MKLICKSSENKILLGRLAVFLLSHKIPYFDNWSAPLETTEKTILPVAPSFGQLLDIAITEQGSGYDFRELLAKHQIKINSLMGFVPFALPVELQEYTVTKRIRHLQYQHVVDFIFGDKTPWQIRDYIMGPESISSVKETVARINNVMHKSMWDDSEWFASLDGRKKLARFKLKRTVETELIHTLAYVEAWYSIEIQIKNNNAYH